MGSKNQLGRDRQKEFYLGGVFLEHVSAYTASPEINTRSEAQYGLDEDIKEIDSTSGQCSITTFTTQTYKRVSRALTGFDPATYGALIEVRPDTLNPIALYANHRKGDDSEYTRAEWMGVFAAPPVGSNAAGSIEDTPRQTFEGSCDQVRYYDDCMIYVEKVAAGGTGPATGTLTTMLGVKPANSDYYCLGVIALSGVNPIQSWRVPNGEAYVAANGEISVPAEVYAQRPDDWNTIQAFAVYKWATGVGTRKTNNPPVATDTHWTSV